MLSIVDYKKDNIKLTILEPMIAKVKTRDDYISTLMTIKLDDINPLDRVDFYHQTSELLDIDVVLSTANAKKIQKTIRKNIEGEDS